MAELHPLELPPNPEHQSHIAQVYEHLYPELKWNVLPTLDPRNLPAITGLFIKDYEIIEDGIVQADKQKKGFALRIDLPHPDKVLLGQFLRSGCIREQTKPDRSSVNDLILPNEKLGGMVLKVVDMFNDEIFESDTKLLAGLLSGNIIENHYVKLIGVQNEQNRSTALIIYKEGPRPLQRITKFAEANELRPVLNTF